jgi:NADH-quinone oxidoreductase subunit J
LLGTISVVAALGMVLAKQPIRSALSLLTCMLALAGIYALRGAHLIFALQLIIYVGAIMVFLIYIIMLFDLKVTENLKRFSALGSVTILAMIMTIVGVYRFAYSSLEQKFSTQSVAREVTTETLSELLVSKYLVAFE